METAALIEPYVSYSCKAVRHVTSRSVKHRWAGIPNLQFENARLELDLYTGGKRVTNRVIPFLE